MALEAEGLGGRVVPRRGPREVNQFSLLRLEGDAALTRLVLYLRYNILLEGFRVSAHARPGYPCRVVVHEA